MKTIGIFANLTKDGILDVVSQTSDWLTSVGIQPILDRELAHTFNLVKYESLPIQEIVKIADCIIVFGGDGTILKVSHVPGITKLPILPVNMGGLGFLTEVALDELESALVKLINGDFQLDERMMLRAKVYMEGSNDVHFDGIALNDAVINKGAFSRMIWLESYIDDQYVATLNGDGLIISTPSGCTAYSLSAGGPIVCPTLNIFILTYICPHTLTFRPQIVPGNSKISIVVKSLHSNILLAMDGQEAVTLKPDSKVEVERSSETLKLIRSQKRSYYEILRTKLKWGEAVRKFEP